MNHTTPYILSTFITHPFINIPSLVTFPHYTPYYQHIISSHHVLITHSLNNPVVPSRRCRFRFSWTPRESDAIHHHNNNNNNHINSSSSNNVNNNDDDGTSLDSVWLLMHPSLETRLTRYVKQQTNRYPPPSFHTHVTLPHTNRPG